MHNSIPFFSPKFYLTSAHLRRTIAGFDLTTYCVDAPVKYQEFANALMQAFDREYDDTHLRSVLKDMYQQDMMLKDLCKHLLDEIGEDPSGELYPDE